MASKATVLPLDDRANIEYQYIQRIAKNHGFANGILFCMADIDSPLEEGLERLEHIEEDLEEIKNRTPDHWIAFRNGVLQGAGAIVGGIIAIILLGWILSLFGLIPGLGTIVHSIQDAMSELHK
jgi:hypothetical protein